MPSFCRAINGDEGDVPTGSRRRERGKFRPSPKNSAARDGCPVRSTEEQRSEPGHERCGDANSVVNRIARCAVVVLLAPVVVSAGGRDPFAWLQPAVTVDAAARARLDRGEVVAGVLPAVDAEIGIFAAARLDADGERLAAWAGSIEQLKKSPYVLSVRRFSDPPRISDLDGMALDDADLQDLRRCRPGDCALKMTADGIASLRQAAEDSASWTDAAQERFRRLILEKVAAYAVDGFARLAPYVDRRKAIVPGTVFGMLLDRSPYLLSPAFADADVERFFYWSKEQYGTGKPVISVTHVEIVRPRVRSSIRVAVIAREILATHYRNASLGITAVTEDAEGQTYLVYVNRSQLDVLGGIFGGWKRAVLEGRVKNESVNVFTEIRRRLESGPPPE